jgi:glycosyltransferase involved in cell wall biosynthesis
MSESNQPGLPPLAVVTVVYQGAATLAATMASVQRCRYPNLQYFVIDGGSTDGTVDIIKAYSGRLYGWVSEPDKGIYDAMNKGIARCRPDAFILMLNCGDVLETDPIEYASQMSDPYRVYFGDFVRLSAGTRRIIKCDERALADRMSICHQSVWIPASLYQRFGSYDSKMRISADYDFLLKLRQAGIGFSHLSSVIAAVTDEGVSEKRFVLGLREQAASKRSHSLPWKWSMVRQYAKHQLRRILLALMGRRNYAGMLGGR